jgi:hypothetical protein
MAHQECCFDTCKSLYFGFPEDGSLALKQVRTLYVIYDFSVDLGGLVVSVLATGPKVRGFDPDR